MNLQEIHAKSVKNKVAILNSSKCGCFNCCDIFEAKRVTKYNEEMDGNYTGICPKCGSDTVIPDSSYKPITVEILNRLYDEFIA